MSQVSKILAWANARIGSHDYDGKCQSFVRQAYEAAGIKSSKGAANATEAWKLWVKSKSKTDIPTGATVYFVGSKPAIGHVGIYIGNGNIIHAAGDKGVKISSLSSMSGWRGWGFQAGKQPTGSGIETAIQSSADGASGDAVSSTAAATKRELSSTQIVSVTGSGGTIKQFISLDNSGLTWELTIVNRDQKIMRPAVLEGIVWETVRTGSPSILRFSVLKDSELIFWEGDTVIFKVGGTGVFYGYIFKKSREKGEQIEVLAYDQLRYFKNKHTYVYRNKNAVQLLHMIASDFKLRIDALSSGKWVIACMGKGVWTSQGHYILAWKTDGKRVYIKDPASQKAMRMCNDLQLWLSQIKYAWIVETEGFENLGDDEVVEKLRMAILGKDTKIDGIFKDGSNYVNLRQFCELLGLEITSKGKEPIVSMSTVKMQIDGKDKTLYGMNAGGTTYVGARAFAESMDKSVGWDSEENRVIIE